MGSVKHVPVYGKFRSNVRPSPRLRPRPQPHSIQTWWHGDHSKAFQRGWGILACDLTARTAGSRRFPFSALWRLICWGGLCIGLSQRSGAAGAYITEGHCYLIRSSKKLVSVEDALPFCSGGKINILACLWFQVWWRIDLMDPRKLSQQRATNDTGVLVLPGLATLRPGLGYKGWKPKNWLRFNTKLRKCTFNPK